MLQKYNDTAAAVALIIFLLGALFYVAQLLFTTESWLAQNGIGLKGSALPVVLALPGSESLLA